MNDGMRKITAVIICIRIQIEITMGFTITVSKTIQMKTLKRTVVSGLSVVGKWGRYIHRRA